MWPCSAIQGTNERTDADGRGEREREGGLFGGAAAAASCVCRMRFFLARTLSLFLIGSVHVFPLGSSLIFISSQKAASNATDADICVEVVKYPILPPKPAVSPAPATFSLCGLTWPAWSVGRTIKRSGWVGLAGILPCVGGWQRHSTHCLLKTPAFSGRF